MKLIFTCIMSILLLSSSLKQNIPKLCINCKHFIPDNIDNKFGKCSLFPKTDDNNFYLVTGNIKEDLDYIYCETARSYDFRCGKNGDFYKKKYTRKNILPKNPTS